MFLRIGVFVRIDTMEIPENVLNLLRIIILSMWNGNLFLLNYICLFLLTS